MKHMSASELIQGKIYRIRRVQPAYNGRKRQVIYTEGKFIGINGCFAEFEIEEHMKLGVAIDNVEEQVREI